ncbi:recombinase family protein [Streptomyces sp. NBC_00161]|uniref:recombinase family protein n=1 Tax=Streptomyces sp. NBC_00161 TaxID=2975671 RepID=UPI0032535A34
MPRLAKLLRVPTPADRGPGQPWRLGTPVPLTLARQIKAHAPHCRAIFTVYEMKRLGRDAAELTALADHLTDHGLVLEMLAGPLPGMYDPSGPGRLLFAFFAAMAELQRELIVADTMDGLASARARGRVGGRRPRLSPEQAALAQQLYDAREKTVQQIADLFGVPRSTVYGHLDKTKAVPRQPKKTTITKP